MNEGATIRRAVPADALPLALVLARAWAWAYRGLIEDAQLAAYVERASDLEAWFRERLGGVEGEWRTWVAERAERVVGFAVTGPSRDADADLATAEVWGLYLDPDFVGRGIGRALFAHAVGDLRQRGYGRATLWVLEGNARARRFYEAAGWSPDGKTKIERGRGFALHEVRYRADLAASGRPAVGGP